MKSIELKELHDKLRKESAQIAKRLPQSSNGVQKLRARLRKLLPYMEKAELIRRGSNNRILFSEEAYQMVLKMVRLEDEYTVDEAAERVLNEAGGQTLPASDSDLATRLAAIEARLAVLERSAVAGAIPLFSFTLPRE